VQLRCHVLRHLRDTGAHHITALRFLLKGSGVEDRRHAAITPATEKMTGLHYTSFAILPIKLENRPAGAPGDFAKDFNNLPVRGR